MGFLHEYIMDENEENESPPASGNDTLFSSSPPPPSPPTSKSSSPPPSPVPPPSPPPPSETESAPPPPSSSSTTPPPPSSPSPPENASPPPPSPTEGSNPPPLPATTGSPPSPPSAAITPPSNNGTREGSGNVPHAPPNPADRNSPTGTDTTLTSPPSSSSSGAIVPIVAGVVIGAVILLALTIIFFVCSKKKKKKQTHYDDGQYYNRNSRWNNHQQAADHVVKFPSPSLPKVHGTPPNVGAAGGWGTSSNNSGQHNQHQVPTPPPLGGLGGYANSQSQFSYQELASATSGFSQANLLGQGGFGYVHKGVLSNGRVVAVKSLKSGSGQGEREFQAEVEIISRVHHRHLVSLVGYCIADGQRMLVYEFVANKTLEHHLHGKGVPVMDWSSRMRIALGSAKGLAYLHEDCHPRIIHRDIKAANILLDENYEAMVADFGLAKLSSDTFTHVSTRVMGTFGYLAPEYASSGKLSDKSDVFSFGVMLLELITGRTPVDLTGQIMEDSLVDWSRPLMTNALENNNYDAIADPNMEGNYVPYEMARMVACASASVRHSAKRRPRMGQIVRSLEGDLALEDLNEGVKHIINPANVVTTPSPSSHDSIYDTGAYNADMLKFRKMVMTTQEVPNTAEYGDTNDYGYK